MLLARCSPSLPLRPSAPAVGLHPGAPSCRSLSGLQVSHFTLVSRMPALPPPVVWHRWRYMRQVGRSVDEYKDFPGVNTIQTIKTPEGYPQRSRQEEMNGWKVYTVVFEHKLPWYLQNQQSRLGRVAGCQPDRPAPLPPGQAVPRGHKRKLKKWYILSVTRSAVTPDFLGFSFSSCSSAWCWSHPSVRAAGRWHCLHLRWSWCRVWGDFLIADTLSLLRSNVLQRLTENCATHRI